MAVAAPPTVEEVRTRLGLPTATVGEAELQDVLDAEVEDQAAVCRVEPYRSALRATIFRRCARHLAAKGVPLGIMTDEYGSSSLHAIDAEIVRLEGPYMRFNIGTPAGSGRRA